MFSKLWMLLLTPMLATSPALQGQTDAGAPSPARPAEQREEAVVKPPKNPPPAALAPDVKDLVNRMQAFYEKTQDFTAGFTQVYKYKAFKRTQTSSGEVAFKKPGYMRWEYQKPTNKTFVLAKEKVYALDPEAMTLTVAAMASHQLSASVTFLWGRGRLTDEFSIRRVDCASCQGTALELTPLESDPRFQRILLEVDPKTAQVLKSTVVDPDGSENAITFTNLKPNVGLSHEKFQITQPPGTKLVDLTKPQPPK